MQVLIHSATVAVAAVAGAAIIASGGLPSVFQSGGPGQGDRQMPLAAPVAPFEAADPFDVADPFERQKREAAEFELPAQF